MGHALAFMDVADPVDFNRAIPTRCGGVITEYYCKSISIYI